MQLEAKTNLFSHLDRDPQERLEQFEQWLLESPQILFDMLIF